MKLSRLFSTALIGTVVLAVGLMAGMSLRAYSTGSRQEAVTAVPKLAIDEMAVAMRLSGAVRFRTISLDERPDASADAFLGLHDYLAARFPGVHRSLKLEKVGQYSLLYTWPGSDPSLKPIMLMAHQDVVPIAPGTEKDWQHDPFGGEIADGFVWGRGAWDDKSNLLAVLEALENLIAKGARPKRTILVASGHDEEVGGERGAHAIADLLKSRGTQLEFVIDEGSLIAEGINRRVAKPMAAIGIAEKGALTLSLAVEMAPGHSSMPPKVTSIGTLAAAIDRLENNQMPARIGGVAMEFFETLAPEMDDFNRVMLSNLWLTEPMVRARLEGQPAMNAMLRTTTAVTVINGGNKANVLPAQANALVNFRILPGDSMGAVERHVREQISNPSITVAHVGAGRDPSPVSSPKTPAYSSIAHTIREVFPDAIVAPGLVIAGTDSRHMTELTTNVYRFLPVRATGDDLARFHGTNERISIANYADLIRFFQRLIVVTSFEQ